MKEIRYRGTTVTRCHLTKFSCPDGLGTKFELGNIKGSVQLGDTKINVRFIIKWPLKVRARVFGLDRFGSGQLPGADSFKHVNKISEFTKGGAFLD
jgi:hypothetical protein